MAEGPAQALGRPGAERGRAADRRARAAADGVPRGHLLGPDRPLRQGRAASDFEAELVSVDGRRIPAGKDFDPATGQLKDADCCCWTRPRAESLAARLRKAEFRVAELEDKPYTSKPYPPFTTSTLQQEANRKLGFTARRTMQVAQSLYENGHITYMRTDSTNLASVAIEAARELVALAVRPRISARPAAALPDQGQERPGSPRSDPAGRPSLRTFPKSSAAS